MRPHSDQIGKYGKTGKTGKTGTTGTTGNRGTPGMYRKPEHSPFLYLCILIPCKSAPPSPIGPPTTYVCPQHPTCLSLATTPIYLVLPFHIYLLLYLRKEVLLFRSIPHFPYFPLLGDTRARVP